MPIDFLEPAEAARVIRGGVEHPAARQQVRVVAERPRVNDATLYIDEVGRADDAEERVAVLGFGGMPLAQLGRAGQRVVGQTANREEEQERTFHGQGYS